MKVQMGDIRAKNISELLGLEFNSNTVASAVDSYDAIDTQGNLYEIKSWYGSWHGTCRPVDTDTLNPANYDNFIKTLESHKATKLVAMVKTKTEVLYMVMDFSQYISYVKRHKNKNTFYITYKKDDRDCLKFRPSFKKSMLVWLNRQYGLEIQTTTLEKIERI